MSGLIIRAANQFSVVFLGTSRSDESAGDRLSYRYTSAILVAFTLIVSNREFTMQRIQCWVPAYFTKNYEDYTNNVCWVRNTYYLEDDKQIPDNTDIRYASSIRYYQWIPFILLFQALFFFLPSVLWRVLCQRSGIDVRDIVEAATSYKKATTDKKREQLMTFMVSVIDQYVDDPRRQSNNRVTTWWKKCLIMFFPSSGRYMGDYLRNLFIFMKLIYLFNVFAQVALLTFLLGQPFWSMGFSILRFLYKGEGWDYQSRYFPKVTLCDFQIREANTVAIAHTYTVMCVLPINLFNQQIFTFLWFWFVVVILLTVYDLCIWIYRLFFRREAHLRGRLKVLPRELEQQWPFDDSCLDHISPEENERLMRVQTYEESATTGDEVFVLSDKRKVHHQSRMFIVPRIYYQKRRSLYQFFDLEYLEADGHFILRIIGTNASDFVATRILHRLYNVCCEKRFLPYEAEKVPHQPRTTLYKYLIIPKESQKPSLSTADKSKKSDDNSTTTTDSSSSEPKNEHRSRPRTSSSTRNTDGQQKSTKRSQSRSRQEE